jgi:hypothetical protein
VKRGWFSVEQIVGAPEAGRDGMPVMELIRNRYRDDKAESVLEFLEDFSSRIGARSPG